MELLFLLIISKICVIKVILISLIMEKKNYTYTYFLILLLYAKKKTNTFIIFC